MIIILCYKLWENVININSKYRNKIIYNFINIIVLE